MGLDDSAFDSLFHRFYSRVLAFFRGRGFDTGRAEDLTQDVFTRVYRHRGGYRGEAEGAWLLEIAGNVYKNELRRLGAKKREATVVPIGATVADSEDRRLLVEPAEAGPDAETQAIERERLARIRAAIAELPDQARRCAELRYGKGMKYREIAEKLGLSVGTVKSHLHTVKVRLAGRLAGGAGAGALAGGES